MSAHSTVVVGVDGAHFELIQPWLDAGELPNVARLLEEGVHADLESVFPPVTSPNWKVYATGKNPGKIGIYWWENVDVAGRRVYYPADRKHHNTEYWEYLAERDDQRVGVVGVPTTYPPKSFDGIMVAGAPDGENEGFTQPPELEAELREAFGYYVTKRHKLKDDTDRAAEEILDLVEMRFAAALSLLEREELTFLQVTTFYINSLHHYLWDDEYTLAAWRIVDEYVGRFLDRGHNVVMMSDHGSTPIRTVFHVNTWLAEEGYLSLETSVSETLHSLGVTTDSLRRLTAPFVSRDTAKRLAPKWLLDHLPDQHGEIERDRKTDHIDWDRTRVLASGQGPLYLTLDPDDPGYDSLRDDLIESLLALRDPAGRSVVSAVHRGEDLYHGSYVDEAPDLVIDQAAGVHIVGSIGRDRVFTDPDADGWRGENKRFGLFAAAGPDFARTPAALESLSILDLAPTLLHLYDCGIPSDMDGTVRLDVFDPESPAAGRSPRELTQRPREAEVQRIRRVARTLSL